MSVSSSNPRGVHREFLELARGRPNSERSGRCEIRKTAMRAAGREDGAVHFEAFFGEDPERPGAARDERKAGGPKCADRFADDVLEAPFAPPQLFPELLA